MRQQNRPSIYSFDLKKQTKTNKKNNSHLK
jgi:hypothetical protein